MALRLYDELERRGADSPRQSFDSHRFSIDSKDEKLNELDPLHSSGPSSVGVDEYETHPLRTLPKRPVSSNGGLPKPRGFLSRREARARKIQKWKSRILVPGRLCVAVAFIVAVVTMAIVGAGGYWVVSTGHTLDGESPPWYSTPKGGSVRNWEESYRKAAAMVEKMTLAEKVNITTGTGWMSQLCVGNTGPAVHAGFPALCLQDGPLGVRFADNITATPAGITVGATWSKELMYKRGKLLGSEYRMKGVNVMLGPSVGPLGKLPAGGRNWEGFGSDPVLQGWAAAETIRGIQEEGVMATIKHYIANEQEHFRQPFEWTSVNSISSNIDDRTLHEVYAWPFADSIRAGVASVMCSYNQVNNSYACQNSKILNGLLKDELGFQGFVQSDWTAQHAGVDSALAGLDMAMPGGGLPSGPPLWGPLLSIAVLNGSLPLERLDDMVTRVVAAWYQLGQDDVEKWPRPAPDGDGGPNFSSWTNDEVGLIHPGTDDKATGKVNKFVDAAGAGPSSHSSLARRVAAEGTVLLKNSGNILPLSRKGWPQALSYSDETPRRYRIAIIGEDSVLPDGGPNVCPDRGCNEGTLASGWGSGAVEFPYVVSPLEALQNVFNDGSVEVKSYPTNDLGGKISELEQMDLCIVFANADAGEGYLAWDSVKGDRPDLFLQKDGDKLIKNVASRCGSKISNATLDRGTQAYKGTVVVIHSVGPVILESFIERSNVRAVVFANLPGQESGNALTDVLFGDVNPSGHLPFTIGKSLDDYGPGSQIIYNYVGNAPQQDFKEGLLIDYRYFDAARIEPRYPFGYGLSYTSFKLENLELGTPYTNGSRPKNLPAPRPENDVQPPTYHSTIPKPSDLLFPSGFRKLKNYIYPYIDSVDEVEKGEYPYPDMTPRKPSAAGGGEGGNPALYEVIAQVNVTLVNTGKRDGQAVVQLYVAFPGNVYEYFEPTLDDVNAGNETQYAFEEDLYGEFTKNAELERRQNDSKSTSDAPKGGGLYHKTVGAVLKELRKTSKEHIYFPPRVLRAFEKVHTYTKQDGDGSSIFREREEQDRKAVTFNLTRRDLSYWSVRQQNWVLPNGTFTVFVGFDSRDLPLNVELF